MSYKAHVMDKGWMSSLINGETAGTVGANKRMEAFQINLKSGNNSGISYQAHCSDIGWQGWKSSGQTAGTTGQKRQVEAIQIKLTNGLQNKFDVYYRAHCSNYGWLGWAKNGETAGTTGLNTQMEAFEVELVLKGEYFARGGQAYKTKTVTASSSGITSPVPAGCKFNAKTYDGNWLGYHDININVSTATPVYAIADGTVTYKQAYRIYSGVKYLTSYGNYIDFKSSVGGYTAKYCHLSRFEGGSQWISSSKTKRVSGSSGVYTTGTKSVKKGQIIGYIGKTGNASGIHLHFELYKNSKRIDPTSVFSGLVK